MRERSDAIKQPNRPFWKDFSWYFLGSFIPLFLGFLKTPVFTRHFSAEEFGYLGLISVTFTYLGMFLFSWIGSCIWRYHSRYTDRGVPEALYSNLAFLYGVSFVVVAFVSLGWYLWSTEQLARELILYSFLQLVLNQLVLFYLVVLRLEGKAPWYTVFQSFRALAGLLVALFMVFVLDQGIVALVSSLALIDLVSLLVLGFFNPAKVGLRWREIRRSVWKELLVYGGVGLILNISMLTLSLSDRYVIALYGDLNAVGIYDQVYKVSQLSIMALITIFFNTINPVFLRILENGKEASVEYLRKYLGGFLLFGLPLVFYLGMYSRELSQVLLGPEFRQGYVMMPYIFAAIFLHGVSNFFELRMKFSDRYKQLGFVAVSTAILNLLLNFILVRRFGFHWAAYTTLVSYVYMVLLFYYLDPIVFRVLRRERRSLVRAGVLLIAQAALFWYLAENFALGLPSRVVLGVIFVTLYFLVMRKDLLRTEIPLC